MYRRWLSLGFEIQTNERNLPLQTLESPLLRSRSSFARIFVFIAFFVEGAHTAASPGCGTVGCCECLCDGASLDPPQYVGYWGGQLINSESQCDQANAYRACNELSGDWASMYCHGDTTRMGNRWLETCECECLCDEVSLTPPHMLAHSYWLERCHSGGGYHYAGDCNNPGVPCSGTWRLNTKCTIPSCTTSQYLKGGSCAACPPSTGASSSQPSATSTGGSATFCTCPKNYYAYAGMNAPSMYDWACQECPVGYSFIKNGSVIPTASGTSDTCDCKAGYYLDNSGLNCHMCDPGTTSAGGRVTECSAILNSDARATGGTTVTTFGDYVIHNFTSNGTFAVTDFSLTEVDVLVVGGGGGGGFDTCGGGGGGGVLYSASKTLSSSSITVTVSGASAGAQQLGRLRGFACFWSSPSRPALFMSRRHAE